jgi:hypothetical protein
VPVAESKEFPRQESKVAGAAIAGFRKLMISLGIGDLRLETELWFWFLRQREPVWFHLFASVGLPLRN